MRILAFADLHAHNHQPFSSRLGNGLNSRFVNCLNIVDDATFECLDRNIDVCVFCGDMFHSRTKIDIDVFTETWKAFRELARHVPLVLLAGNHDQCSKVGDIHSLEPFRDFATVVSQPQHFSNAEPFLGLNVGFLPYIDNIDKLRSELDVLPETNILFMHQPVRGAIPGSDNLLKPEFDVEDIPWDRVKLVISGDIHTFQEIKSKRFLYLGSPLQKTFGDADKLKFFSVINTKDFSIETIQTQAPKFFLREAFDDDPDPLGINLSAFSNPAKDFIKLRHSSKWRRSADSLLEEYPRLILEEVGKEKQVLQRVSNEVVGNDRKLLCAYIDQVGCGDLDRHKLIQTGLEELSGSEL